MDHSTVEPIAVIGMALSFPGGNTTPAGLAEFLRAGRSGIVPTPPDRWSGVELITASGGGYLAGIDRFDAQFFNTSPKEAAFVDPQQRLVLETAWKALESAGVDPAGVEGEGGVYLGCSMADYAAWAGELADEQLTAHLGAGLAPSAIPGRLSHFLGWHGPSLNVDTACSSSLVTLHLAAHALRAGECSIALAGGINLIHHPRNHVIFSQAGMLSPDGRCRTFDQHADGYGRSEGCGMLVLKRLSDAEAAGDTVLALLTGSAVRQDGASGGLTVPNGLAQADVMRRALASAGLTPDQVPYVEAHGTGTPLGDPIEVAAINAVFAPSRGPDDPVLIASLKGNLGHLEAAAGVGGVIKSVLQLRDEMIYPHVGMTTPSEHIPWRRFRVSVPTEGRGWPAGPRRGLVNSFGFAGTIASVVLEQAPAAEAPAAEAPPPAGGEQLLVVSAKSASALRRRLTDLRDFLAVHPDVTPADLSYTCATRRAHFAHRFGAAGSRPSSLRLGSLRLGSPRTSRRPGRRRSRSCSPGRARNIRGWAARSIASTPSSANASTSATSSSSPGSTSRCATCCWPTRTRAAWRSTAPGTPSRPCSCSNTRWPTSGCPGESPPACCSGTASASWSRPPSRACSTCPTAYAWLPSAGA